MGRASNIQDLLTITEAAATLKGAATYGPIRVVDRAAGSTLTLPAATGQGGAFSVILKTTITSNALIIQVPDAAHILAGIIMGASDDADNALAWKTAADSDTITLNGSTTGGLAGDRIDLIDIAPNVWQVTGSVAQSGAEATPFSAAVS